MVRRTLLLVLMLTLTALMPLSASPLGISLSTWSSSAQLASGRGIHVSGGFFIQPTSRLEIEVQGIASLTPYLGENVLGSVFISTPFAGPLYHPGGAATLYYNGLVGVGYLGGWDTLNARSVHAVGVRVIPFTLGGAYYGRRERTLALTLLWDIPNQQLQMSWSLLGFDLYLRRASAGQL
jgi:hypothetical protein